MAKTLKQYSEDVIGPKIAAHENQIVSVLESQVVAFNNHYSDKSICGLPYTFRNYELEKVLEILGYNSVREFKNEIRPLLKNKDHRVASNEFTILLVFLIDHFNREGKSEKAATVNKYLHARTFSIIHKKYFTVGCKEDIMNTVFDTMTYKFLFKKFNGNIVKIIEHAASETFKKQRHKLGTGTDKGFIDYLIYARGKINGFVKNIAKVYYPLDKKKRRTVMQGDVIGTNKDGEEFTIERQSDSSDILSTSNKLYSTLQGTQTDDSELTKSFGAIPMIFQPTKKFVIEKESAKELMTNHKLQSELSKLFAVELKRKDLLEHGCTKSDVGCVFNAVNTRDFANEFKNTVTKLVKTELDVLPHQEKYFVDVIILFYTLKFMKIKCK